MPDPVSQADISALRSQIDQLKADLQAVKAWQSNLQGDGNIRVEGNQIVLARPQGSSNKQIVSSDITIIETPPGGGGGGGAAGGKKVVIVDNGTANYYLVLATFVGPV